MTMQNASRGAVTTPRQRVKRYLCCATSHSGALPAQRTADGAACALCVRCADATTFTGRACLLTNIILVPRCFAHAPVYPPTVRHLKCLLRHRLPSLFYPLRAAAPPLYRYRGAPRHISPTCLSATSLPTCLTASLPACATYHLPLPRSSRHRTSPPLPVYLHHLFLRIAHNAHACSLHDALVNNGATQASGSARDICAGPQAAKDGENEPSTFNRASQRSRCVSERRAFITFACGALIA